MVQISLPPGGHKSQIRPSMFSLSQTPRLCPDRRWWEPASLSHIVSWNRKAFPALWPQGRYHTMPFEDWDVQKNKLLLSLFTPCSGLARAAASFCSGLWIILEHSPPESKGHSSWEAGGYTEPFLIHSAVRLQLQVIFRYKQSPKLIRNVFFSFPQVFAHLYWSLRRHCLHPKTGTEDPRHQVLLKVGAVWGIKVPPSTAGSRKAP